MDQLKKLESIISGWLKPVPNLPQSVKKWLSENIWWLAIISLVVSVISALVLVGAIVAYSAATAIIDVNSVYTPNNVVYDGTWLISAIFDLVVIILTVVILASAIKPLQSLRYRGWFLLFILLILSTIRLVVSAILSLNVFVFIMDIIFGAIGLAIAAYLLFQIRGRFGVAVHRPVQHSTTTKK
jgi:hypothetical protein